MENQKKVKVGYFKKAWGVIRVIENNPTYKKIFTGAVLVVLIFMFVSSLGSSDGSTQVAHPVPIEVGTEGKAFLAGGGTIPIFATKDLFDKYMRAVNTNDKYGQLEVMASGKVYPVNNGTKVLVIDSTFAMSKVRILEGVNIGHSGWVPYEFIVEK